MIAAPAAADRDSLPGPDITHHATDKLQLEIPSHQTVCQRRSHNSNLPVTPFTRGFPGLGPALICPAFDQSGVTPPAWAQMTQFGVVSAARFRIRRALALGRSRDHGVAVAGIVEVGIDFPQSCEFQPFAQFGDCKRTERELVFV